MKSRQFCSVCKQWLEMEVVPTGDGDDDDGVIWFRCPQCQGFLPKLSGDGGGPDEATIDEATTGDPTEEAPAKAASTAADADMPWDSPADMMAARRAGSSSVFLPEEDDAGDLAEPDGEDVLLVDGLDDDDGGDDATDDDDADRGPGRTSSRRPKPTEAKSTEPIHEYAAMLADLDASAAVPYRPWETYEVGQCVHHLAWDECGVVVAKESLPGGRHVIKCYFEAAGVVRLIEQAAP